MMALFLLLSPSLISSFYTVASTRTVLGANGVGALNPHHHGYTLTALLQVSQSFSDCASLPRFFFFLLIIITILSLSHSKATLKLKTSLLLFLAFSLLFLLLLLQHHQQQLRLTPPLARESCHRSSNLSFIPRQGQEGNSSSNRKRRGSSLCSPMLR